MNCALWLNRRKVCSAAEIPKNFDLAAIRGYYLGGSLVQWLSEHGGDRYADELSRLSPDDPQLNDRLAEIFGQKCREPVHKADEMLIVHVDRMRSGGVGFAQVQGSGGSFMHSGSFSGGSFTERYGSGGYLAGSFGIGSYRFGSYAYLWEWEWQWRYAGSFRYGSYRAGSFGGAYGSFAGGFGSYGAVYGSFARGSFVAGSWRNAWSMRSVPLNSMTGSFGAFRGAAGSRLLTSDEYDEIMYRCLNICPLNRFGYGIHLI